jgi:hypothetical protein
MNKIEELKFKETIQRSFFVMKYHLDMSIVEDYFKDNMVNGYVFESFTIISEKEFAPMIILKVRDTVTLELYTFNEKWLKN